MSRPRLWLNSQRRLAVLGCAIGLVVGACSSGGATPSTVPGSTPPAAGSPSVPTSGPSAGPTATPGPATAAFTLAGGSGVSGAASKLTIRCATPSLDGQTIDMFGVAGATVNLRITLSAGRVAVAESSGAGATFAARTFDGSGVTGFDPLTGATVDSPLSEVTGTGTAPGSLGPLTTIKGTVACGNQAPGTSTLVFTGDGPEGRLAAGVDPVSVECVPYAAGDRVSVIGLTKAGSTPILLVISLAADSFSVAAWPRGAPTSRFYQTTKPGSASLVPGGAHVSGDATEPYVATNPLMLHVEGNVTCGWTASP